MKNEKEIKEILERGVDEVIDKDNLLKKLQKNQKLRLKLGIDPTSPNIHLGRSIPLLKLRDFQKLGHKIVLIIGDFTGMIGDTSDKDSERPMLTEEQIQKNLTNYKEQAGKIIDLSAAEVYHNSEWLKDLTYLEIGYQANIFSLNEFISRENISKRLKEGKRISLREVLYPLMQGYDSVKIKADVEVGGTDQRFNLLTGRTMQKHYKMEPQDIITNPLIDGLDGTKMSSSKGNTINFIDSPNEMFGKVMSLQDDLIINYFLFLTRVEMERVEDIKEAMASGGNPRDAKMELAKEIVKMYHSSKDAASAEDYFIKTFSKKEIPDEVPEFHPTNYNIIDTLVESGLTSSRGEARRVLSQKGVKVDGVVVEDNEYTINQNSILQKGKIKFLKII